MLYLTGISIKMKVSPYFLKMIQAYIFIEIVTRNALQLNLICGSLLTVTHRILSVYENEVANLV
jgi:hypothetical protein